MRTAQIQVTGKLRRSVPGALALALIAAGVLAGTGTAAAAQHGTVTRRTAVTPHGETGPRGAASRPAGRLVAGTISTVAGGLGGPAKGTKVAMETCGVEYGSGKIYVAGHNVVRTLDPASGRVATYAGNGLGGGTRDGIPAVDASLSDICPTAVDPHGNLVMIDMESGTILVVAARTGSFYQQHMTAGDIYTVGPSFGLTLDGGLAVDAADNLLITNKDVVEVVAERSGTFYGQKMTPGGVYIVAGSGKRGFSGDGGPATTAKLDQPFGVTVDSAGNVVFADSLNNRVRVVAVKTGTFYGTKMTAGDIYTVAGNGTGGYAGDRGAATKAELWQPVDVAVDGAGNPVIADWFNARVRVVAVKTGTFYGQKMTAGDIYTVAGNGQSGFSGDGGPATAAEFAGLAGVAVDASGNLVIADIDNNRIRVVAVKTGTFYGIKMTAADIYTVAGDGSVSSSGNGGPALKAEFTPLSVAADGAGNVLIADSYGNQIRVAAATTGTFYGKKMTAGDIYGVAGTGTAGFSGDGGPATKAELQLPTDVVADGAGNLVIADSDNQRIRVVAATTGTFYGQAMTAGDIYTVAGHGYGFSGDGGPATKAELHMPVGVAVDSAGNLVIDDSFNDRVRVVAVKTGTFYGVAMTADDIYTVAGNGTCAFSGDGGPATAAQICVGGVGADGAGNLLIADAGNNRVRVVAGTTGTFYGQAMTAGDIYTVAGNGSGVYSGDGGPATAAGMDFPQSAAVDAVGNLLIGDTRDDRIRVVAATTGTFYGVAMTAGDIYTVAGNGTCGFSGDGGPATAAQICGGLAAADGAGNLLIAEGLRIREVTG